MKNTLILLLILFGSDLWGQTFLNGNFNTWTFSSGDCNYNLSSSVPTATSPFIPGCGFYGWMPTHGSPEIYKSGAENAALMWAGRWSTNTGITGEGIGQYCNFKQGKVYHMTCSVASSPGTNGTGSPIVDDHIDHVYLKLANGVSFVRVANYEPVSSEYTIKTPLSEQLLFHVTNLYGSQNIDLYFTPDQNYTYLWVYPYHSNGPSRIATLLADNFALEPCQSSAAYSNTSSLPAVTLRSDYITAATNTTVLNGQTVSFSAGYSITLDVGFTSASGSNFTAYMGGCDAQFSCTNPWLKPSSVDDEVAAPAVIQVSPNPGSGLFTLNVNNDKLKDIYMYDMLGKVVYTNISTSDEQFDIDIRNNANGLYFIKVISGTDVQTIKVVNQ